MGKRQEARGRSEEFSSLMPHASCFMPNLRGFTLVEMSIVVSIIGLILGGIVLGKTVVRRSQINSVAVAEQQYVQAALQFQQHYGMLPGDFSNATTYWGSLTTAGLTCPPAAGSTNSSGGTLTCNGNGDGWVSNNSGSSATAGESFLFWQHLANAQLISGYFTGIAGSGGYQAGVIGGNVPASRVSGAGFYINYFGMISGSVEWFSGNYGHAIRFGAGTSAGSNDAPALTALEAQAFDSKYDDGSPAYGNIRTLIYGNAEGVSQNCATTAVASTALYNVGSIGPQCMLVFITGF